MIRLLIMTEFHKRDTGTWILFHLQVRLHCWEGIHMCLFCKHETDKYGFRDLRSHYKYCTVYRVLQKKKAMEKTNG